MFIGLFSAYHRQLAEQIAEQRDSLHRNDHSHRPLSNGYELIGILGEIAFAQTYLLPLDTRVRHNGDKGVDFRTPIGTIDVKTAQKAYYLLVEVGKADADIYVLAGYDSGAVRLLGWEWGRAMTKCPVKEFSPGLRSHYLPVSLIRPMGELDELLLAAIVDWHKEM